MGIFETLKNKDVKELYETLKEFLHDILHNPSSLDENSPSKPSQPLSPSTSSQIENSQPEQRQALKNVKKILELFPANPNTILLSLDFESKSLTPEVVLALIRALNLRNDRNQFIWQTGSLSLASTEFTLISTPSPSNKNSFNPIRKSDGNGGPREAYHKRIEDALLRELCSWLASTRTLTKLNLSNNQLGNNFCCKLLLNGLRFNSSLTSINLRNCHLDGGIIIPEVLIEILVKITDTHELQLSQRRMPQIVTVNTCLRSINIGGHSWNKEALEKLAALAFTCIRIEELDLGDELDSRRIMFNSKSLFAILQRNKAITAVMDQLLNSVLSKRSFKDKLVNFKASIKENRLKNKLATENANESTPVYKLIAMQNQEGRFDPFHPTIFPSARWKSGYALSIGQREEMQDVVAMRGKFREIVSSTSKNEISYEDWWAVYDGHGGREAASYVADNLHQTIAYHLDKTNAKTHEMRAESIKAAFKQTQKEMAPWNTITGTTVLGVYIHENTRFIVNLGDSRAILFNRKTGVRVLSKDHRPNDPNEKRRIMKLHGAFIEDGKVSGKLSVSRALGDSSLSPFVSSEPDVTWEDIDKEDEFIVLASDGLWDIFGSDGPNPVEKTSIIQPGHLAKFLEGCKTVVDIVHKSSTASNASKKLCEYAYHQGSRDNISVIVIHLNYLKKQESKENLIQRCHSERAVKPRPSNVPLPNPLFKGKSEILNSGNAVVKKASEIDLAMETEILNMENVHVPKCISQVDENREREPPAPVIQNNVRTLETPETVNRTLYPSFQIKKSIADSFVDEMLEYMKSVKLK